MPRALCLGMPGQDRKENLFLFFSVLLYFTVAEFSPPQPIASYLGQIAFCPLAKWAEF